ncbi:spore germination protein KC [Paenibacillus mucilaginosus 3016]|uniref:Spore germination protein KC n=2 Tax=Paenibacillus mucilaginosus TaxID=61624 RepID=H6NB21_9BACL|nr:Ger(x)C family spore germination protein [Paenibacillus mucilaginosus]AFC31276.1 spore germination protein KC [Paenibacillus mucilaginosus 3016]WFA19841.1 Ger(x)C family spore germination protein [Paenibacillus mucilaginosus]
MKRARGLALVGLLLGLAGCWDRTEVNDMAFTMAMSIDKAGDRAVEVSVQIFIPRSSGGGGGGGGGGEMQSGQHAGGATLVRSAVGKSIGEALSKLQEQVPRFLFLGHNEVYVIGEEAARDGITDHVDFLARAPQSRKRAYVFISRGKGKEMLKTQSPLERSSAEVVREMAAIRTGLSMTVKDMEVQLSGQSDSLAVPLLEREPSGNSGKSKEGGIHYIRGLAVIKKGKMVGTMDDTLARGVLWVRNEMNSAVLSFPAGGERGGTVSVRSWKNHARLVPELRSGEVVMTVVVKAETYMLQNTSGMNPMDPKINRQLESQLNAALDQRIRRSIQTAQNKWNADIFGFADAISRQYPQQWRQMKGQWDKLFPKLQVMIQAQGTIERSGAIGGSTAVKPAEVMNP